MKKSEMSIEQLVGAFHTATVETVKYPTNKTKQEEFERCIKEFARRFNTTVEEIDKYIF